MAKSEKELLMLRDFFLGFIKIHILHHASQEPVYGLWLIEELSRHGYKLSAGTLYPILHRLERENLLKSYSENIAGKIRKYYRTTPKGEKMLLKSREKIKELVDEVMEQAVATP
jgi:DNA-binding PadR family transcriptional regulator